MNATCQDSLALWLVIPRFLVSLDKTQLTHDKMRVSMRRLWWQKPHYTMTNTLIEKINSFFLVVSLWSMWCSHDTSKGCFRWDNMFSLLPHSVLSLFVHIQYYKPQKGSQSGRWITRKLVPCMFNFTSKKKKLAFVKKIEDKSYISLYGAVVQAFRTCGNLSFNSFVFLTGNEKKKGDENKLLSHCQVFSEQLCPSLPCNKN